MSIDEFKKRFPFLAREMLEAGGEDLELVIERLPPDPWRGYVPTVEDYLRRCNTIDEAMEVLDYLEKHGKITSEEAEYYRGLIREKGLEAVGPHKEGDYYYKKAVEYWNMLKRLSRE